ncbi:MAG: enoyl-CoA hydratase-related protein [Pseudomonadota bacterium]|nr:enoyl-CoA hydratase-related protein [Pseudomonadota bacterium]
MTYQEIIYEKKDGVGTITINRPERYNACTPVTIYELTQAFTAAWVDEEVGVVTLTGAGDKAFCVGGDQTLRERGGYGGAAALLPLEVGWQQVSLLIRTIPKPVIARVNGFAIGGGNVFQVVCDLSIASETAQFGQAGPRVGSFDPGYGTGDLVRNVGMKKAKEIWYMCRRYTAREALAMGLVNAVVPPDMLDAEVEKWSRELLEKSPTALKMLKYAFHGETDGVMGISNLGVGGLSMFYETEESLEGKRAFVEKRRPDYSRFRRK